MNKRELIAALENVVSMAEKWVDEQDIQYRLINRPASVVTMINRRSAEIATVRGFLNHISEMPKPKGEQPVATGRRVVLEEPHDEKYEAQPLDLPGSDRTNKTQRRQAMDEALGAHSLDTDMGVFSRVQGRLRGDTVCLDLETSGTAEEYLTGDSGLSFGDILRDALASARSANDADDGDVDRANRIIDCGQCEGTGETDAMGHAETCPVCDGQGFIPNPDYVACQECDDTGQVHDRQEGRWIDCPACVLSGGIDG